jgi:hypothetical protein
MDRCSVTIAWLRDCAALLALFLFLGSVIVAGCALNLMGRG